MNPHVTRVIDDDYGHDLQFPVQIYTAIGYQKWDGKPVDFSDIDMKWMAMSHKRPVNGKYVPGMSGGSK